LIAPTLELQLGDFRLTILDLFRPQGAGLEPKNNPKCFHPKSQIGTVKIQNSKAYSTNLIEYCLLAIQY
jgi:hypothetical protein